jgi:uncharacterized repeat protein (TIGR03803 family)
MKNVRRHPMQVFAIILSCGALLLGTLSAEAQTFTVLHNFTLGADGGGPDSGVTIDAAGNLYGTTVGGGNTTTCGFFGCGIVYKLTHKNAGWILNPLYAFNSIPDGYVPYAPVVISSNGAIYGTTFYGGQPGGGTVYELTPPQTAPKSALTPWLKTQVYTFRGAPDGAYPGYGQLVFDQAGNLYGTSSIGGNRGAGAVFKLTPSGGGWTESILYNFQGGTADGVEPLSGVAFDRAGNLYGTTVHGGPSNDGVVYQLSPSGSGWVEHVLHFFQGSDGLNPQGGVATDPSGNVYGTTETGGSSGGGTVYELSPSGNGWNFQTLYSFPEPGAPMACVTLDAAGNLYGTTYLGGSEGFGNIFKLTHDNSGWHYSEVYDFTTSSPAGGPVGGVSIDANGNLFGTTQNGGTYGRGTVWEVTP